MASPPDTLPKKPRSFDPPEEPVWHRMIAESAYYLAERRGFVGEHSLDDWLAAEQQVRLMLSPNSESEVTMDATRQQRMPAPAAAAQAAEPARSDNPKRQERTRFEKFAATQAAGDGIQGDALKKGQTDAERIGANMADRK